jgi:DEAD/DEAH box helicase domain-containing protein
VFRQFDDLGLCSASLNALKGIDDGIYEHQHEGIRRYLSGENLAITTPTASGKTLVFNVCAIEELAKKPRSRVAAIYPLKALAAEQTDRWKNLARESGLPVKVGRIDGGVQVAERLRILKESRIVVMTPDIIHAWLLSSIAMPAVLDFLRDLTLVIADEAHTYSGVFGSNSAFLFRRLIHANRKLGGKFRFIASSATMQDASTHLFQLTGAPFGVVGPESDTSPQSALYTLLVTPPNPKDLLTSVSDLVAFAATKTDHQSITFADSRKQTEYLASIVERKMGEGAEDDADEVDFDRLRDLQIYPYRSGYEEDDRQRIQKRLASGALKGVVSTSALEMGIDLPYLSLGILVGIPRSATSLYQRIGRVGRRMAGLIIIVNNGSVVSESIFREPARLAQLPLLQSALYLHNQRIQYIHAMCLARQGGEDATVCQRAGIEEDVFTSPIDLPPDYAELCEAERVGEIGTELQSMKAQAGDDPNHTFPLRDLDTQFKVESRQGPIVHSLGSLSQAQVMREAYPGAVYYYQTRTYRVVSIKKNQRLINVRPEKRYFTSPIALPTLILPNLAADNVFQAQRYGDLLVIECAMQVCEAVVGFKERRGNNEFNVNYPLDRSLGLFYDAAKYARYSFTSGVVVTHPALNRDQVKGSAIAELIDEAFLMSLPFERQDINAGADKHRATREPVTAGDRFVCIYDQTYGSLRLTSHLMKTEVLRDVFARAAEIATNDPNFQLGVETLAALQEMADCILEEPVDIDQAESAMPASEKYASVILPGSFGIDTHKDNEEFEVEGVFYSPMFSAVSYRGYYSGSKRKTQLATARHSATTVIVRADHICPLDGESKTGYFNLETGEMVASAPLPGEF